MSWSSIVLISGLNLYTQSKRLPRQQRHYFREYDATDVAQVDPIDGIAMVPPPPPATQDGRSRLSIRMRSAEIAQEIDIDVPTF